MERGEVLWTPPADAWQTTALGRFATQQGFDDLAALTRWSTADLDGFWRASTEFTGVRWATTPTAIRDGATMPGVRWFPGGTLNYAEQALAPGLTDPHGTAVIAISQTREPIELTWEHLALGVRRCAAALRQLGVGPGDRVVAYAPNIPETLVAFLATASLGAVWSSCAPEFGVRSVIDRFAQIEPTVLVGVDGYRYGSQDIDRRDNVADIVAALPTLRHAVHVPYLHRHGRAEHAATVEHHLWDNLLLGAPVEPSTFTPVAADHPLYVLFSSGTTGLPKAIVHGHGGIVAEHLKVLTFHQDLRPSDRFFWFTTTGWMMWNFLLSGLLTRAAIVLYDGNPGHPDMGVLWDLAERAGITCFGTSASFIAASMKAGVVPGEGRDLSALRAVGSTGSPLSPEGFDWVYEQLGRDTWLFSTSGGTDLCTAFVGGVPTLPVYRGELQARALGAAVEAWDEDGNPVIDEVGELVVTEPMPSMPLYLWGDEDGSRYRDSYFDHYPGVWRHGDWIEITSRGTAIIYGRSDSTINRSGIRMGTSEIYRAVAAVDAVTDALVVDLPRPGTEGWMPLFVVLREGEELDDDLRRELARSIREHCSPRHVPDEVFAIEEVPRTLSGKVLEVPVKKILMGTAPERAASRDSLANPAALDYFVEMAAELRASADGA